jgi:hypothetical protein
LCGREQRWFGLPPAARDILTLVAEIERQPDRGGGSRSSRSTRRAVAPYHQISSHSHESVEQKTFQGDGPLATFSAKIDLGLLLGLYTPQIHKQFHRIRKIRNEFAHNMKPITFRSQKVRDLCANLKFGPRAQRIFFEPFERMEPGDFKDIATELAKVLRPTNVPRRQFMRSVQFLMVLLALMRVVRDRRGVHYVEPIGEPRRG